MKKIRINPPSSAITFFYLFIVVINIQAQSPIEVKQDAPTAESLRPYVTKVRSINPTDEEFSDLTPLISKIGNARVVVLGEATHSEGTTSKAKARMVRFLHQKMGFDVLAWESGLFQTHALNDALRNADMPLHQAKRLLMAGGWANEEAIDPVFQYARASWKTSRPLEMSGFDTGKPRGASQFFKEFFTYLGERNSVVKLMDEEWKQVDVLQKRGYGFFSAEVPLESDRQKQRRVLQNLSEKLRTNKKELIKTFSQKVLTFAERFIHDSLMSEEINQIRQTKGGLAWNIARDEFMADSFRWSMENLYSDRKVIIWAATAHLIRNGDRIENLTSKDSYQTAHHMGNHLYPWLGNDLYTIAFTAYGGRIGDIFPEGSGLESQTEDAAPAPPNSFEETAHSLKHPYLFLDLRTVPKSHWLQKKFVSLALGRLENSAQWSDIIDAFFFIDEAEPIRYLPKQM